MTETMTELERDADQAAEALRQIAAQREQVALDLAQAEEQARAVALEAAELETTAHLTPDLADDTRLEHLRLEQRGTAERGGRLRAIFGALLARVTMAAQRAQMAAAKLEEARRQQRMTELRKELARLSAEGPAVVARAWVALEAASDSVHQANAAYLELARLEGAPNKAQWAPVLYLQEQFQKRFVEGRHMFWNWDRLYPNVLRVYQDLGFVEIAPEYERAVEIERGRHV